MQNVSRIQRHPDTLIKNFFIAGLQQQTLRDDIFPAGNENEKRDLYNLTPQMLFSLYLEPDQMGMYLGQVFPDKISILRGEKLIDPKFFSFMCTDMDGFNQYNHCLIFYERFTAELIRTDFDQGKYIEKLVHLRRKHERPGASEDDSGAEGFGQIGINNKAAKVNEKVHLPLLQALKNEKEKKQQDTALMLSKQLSQSSAHKNSFRVATRSAITTQPSYDSKTKGYRQTEGLKKANTIRPGISTAASQAKPKIGKQPTLEEVKETQEEHMPNSLQNTVDYGQPEFGRTRAELQPEGSGRSDAMYHREQLLNMQISLQNLDKSRLTKDSFMSDPSTGPRTDHGSINIKHADTKPSRFTEADPSREDDHLRLSEPDMSRKFHSAQIPQVSKAPDTDYYFAPIAFVIQTEVEHHDIFKEVLLQLFESIRVPEQVTEDEQDNQDLAYAEFLSHLAFLISIPCPTFNTRFYIEFFDKTLTLTEPRYDEIPDKNQLAIRVLFEMLDVRTILYCWKAILFDKTLVLISSQYSLQFYIAQALLQLVFPLTFQYSYVQPASAQRIGMVQSPFPILFACSNLVQTFEQFEALNKDHIAICDIDGSFTNNLRLPELEDENTMLRSLSALKNFKGARYDSAFKEMHEDQLRQSDRSFTIEARNVFFGILNQFLCVLCDGSYFRQNLRDDEEQVFVNYFMEDDYLSWFEGSKNFEFAQQLMNSQLFASFCDDWFDQDVSNMLIYMNISTNGFDFDAADKDNVSMQKKFDERMDMIKQQVLEAGSQQQQNGFASLNLPIRPSFDDKKSKKGSTAHSKAGSGARKTQATMIDPDAIYLWPKSQQVEVCWRMPIDNQRVMIYERLAYTIEAIEEQRLFQDSMSDFCNFNDDKEKEECSQNHKQQVEQVYQKIKSIKRLYAKKLPEYHSQLFRASKDSPLDSSQKGVRQVGAVGRLPAEMVKVDSAESRAVNPMTMSTGDDSQNFGSELKRQMTAGKQANVYQSSEFVDLSDLKKLKDKSNSIPKFEGSPNDITPKAKQKRQHVFNNQVSMMQKTAEYDGFSQEDSDYQMQKLYEKRQRNKNRFCKNRIVELCYGQTGLIEFLDLLFTQFPQRRVVKCKFNYYFAIRKQLQAIEQQIQSELELNTDKESFCEWHDKHRSLLASLIPQRIAYIQNTVDTDGVEKEEHKGALGDKQHLDVQLSTSSGLTEYTMQGPQFLQSDEHPPFTRSVTSIVVKGLKSVRVEGEQEKPKSKMFEMQDAQYNPNPLQIKEGKLNVFMQGDIATDKWMLPVIPDKVELDDERTNGQEFSEIQKLVAFRTSYQYISLKQKLFFAFEDQEEAITLIFGELLLFQPRDRQIFPAARFKELLQLMSEPQKQRIFKRIVEADVHDATQFFQLRMMFEHEFYGMDADKDEPVSLDHKLFQQDFLAPQPSKAQKAQQLKLQQMQAQAKQKQLAQSVTLDPRTTKKSDTKESFCIIGKKSHDVNRMRNRVTSQITEHIIDHVRAANGSHKLSAQLGTTKEIRVVGQPQPSSAPQYENHILLNQTVAETTERCSQFSFQSTKKSIVTNKNFDVDRFTSAHRCTAKPLGDPDKQVLKMMTKLLNIYMNFFDPKIFNEEKQEVRDKLALPAMINEMKKLREYEYDRLSSREIFFGSPLGCAESAADSEATKRCFWTNLCNFKMLQKILEVLLTQPKLLKNHLVNCTMFVNLMASIQVSIQNETLTCYEIFKTILRHEDVRLLMGPFEEPVRSLEEMPESLRELAVTESHSMSSFAIFMPVKKLTSFDVYRKETFEEQLQEVIFKAHDKLQVDQSNFLQRIPKFFFWKLGETTKQCSERQSTITVTQNTDAVMILQQMIEKKAFREEQRGAVLSVLKQISNEQSYSSQANQSLGETSAHLFEIDSFVWKFDILALRASLRDYCKKQEIWNPQSQVASVTHSSENPLGPAQKIRQA